MTKTQLLQRLIANADEAVMLYVDASAEEGRFWLVDRRGFVKAKATAASRLIDNGMLVCVARQWPSRNPIFRPACDYEGQTVREG